MASPTAPPTAPAWLPPALGAAFAVEFAALAWAPYDRSDWLLENLLAAPLAVGLLAARRRLPLSTTGWVCVFAFLALHEVGSHYTYSRVPWMDWSRDLLGWAPAWERNHYDRLVHFSFGLLITRPLRELLAPALPGRPALLRLLTVCVVLACSDLYEILEWWAARVADPELGIAFVGAQGDVWDAQKDTSLALAGSLLVTLVDWIRQRGRGPR